MPERDHREDRDYFRNPGRPGAANLSMRRVTDKAREAIDDQFRAEAARDESALDAALLALIVPAYPSRVAQNN
jgi:hypothetical protein